MNRPRSNGPPTPQSGGGGGPLLTCRRFPRAFLILLLVALTVGLPTDGAASPAETLALLEATPRPARDPIALASSLTGQPVSAAETEPFQGPLAVGRRDTFLTLDTRNTVYVPREAELRVVSERAYWYVEVGRDVAQDALEQSARSFDEVTYPLVHRLAGPERSSGIDGDPRITVFMGTVIGPAAYFYELDLYPRSVFPYSNEREMVHVSLGAVRPGTPEFDGTLAHEFQHLVHRGQNPVVETWLDEGYAELASFLAVPGEPSVTQQLARAPDVQLTSWSQDRFQGAHYQASFLFARYLASRFGLDALRELVAEGGRPPESIDRYLRRAHHGKTFDAVFLDWVVANLLDDTAIADGRYGYDDVEHRAVVDAHLRVDGAPLDGEVFQHGADYVELTGDGGDAELAFAGDPTARLVGTDPPSGRSLWWTNRGDSLETTMTRGFDLRGLTTATLQFNVWYDVERHYDYLYVMASVDDGGTWQVLRGAQMTDEDPTGNAVGPGYTGLSGVEGSRDRDGTSTPTWIADVVDLSPYAGGDVLVRFVYTTDSGTNFRGALVDDIQVPELGYADDAEADTGWEYDGFLRSDNLVPQPWGLRLVEYRRGGEVVVRPLVVGEDGRLSERLPALGGDLERAVLTISGLAPRTLEPSRYQVSLQPAP